MLVIVGTTTNIYRTTVCRKWMLRSQCHAKLCSQILTCKVFRHIGNFYQLQSKSLYNLFIQHFCPLIWPTSNTPHWWNLTEFQHFYKFFLKIPIFLKGLIDLKKLLLVEYLKTNWVEKLFMSRIWTYLLVPNFKSLSTHFSVTLCVSVCLCVSLVSKQLAVTRGQEGQRPLLSTLLSFSPPSSSFLFHCHISLFHFCSS